MARAAASNTTAKESSEPTGAAEKAARRRIPGNLPYTSSPGVLRRVLEKIPVSEKPSVFNTDFLATVMDARGGAARPIPPILKATGLLNQSGNPTELYAQFQTSGGHASAALQALRNGFPEIFKRNTYAHRADEAAILDIIVSVTGLPKTDAIVRYMYSTFSAFQDSAKGASEDSQLPRREEDTREASEESRHEDPGGLSKMHLVYNINVVLPETTNVEVFNAIFKSLRGNLLG